MKTHKKVILVTGSSRGIGRGIALQLAARGYSVAINYVGNKQAAEETQKLCESVSIDKLQKFGIFQSDISLDTSRRSLIENVLQYFGDFHGLINNAGVAPMERKDVLDMSEDSFDHLMDTNLKGTFFLSQLASQYWLKIPAAEREIRSLIFITSVSSEVVSLNRGEYCIAKAGLSMVVKLFAHRLAAEQIGVFEVRPGIIQTDMTEKVKGKYDALISGGLVPQKRWGTPDDLGRIVTSLLSGDFGFSTGSIIHADGGLHIPTL
ncbi:MAG: 3-ketoacyl-ACP reductase [Spirochaetaceae bacterium]|jgi:3-oxoacyl-[acyl-carrier protein] reductase|nr:3-ketoacyl-ACP reductase [Spirochaetaceae bacterium]